MLALSLEKNKVFVSLDMLPITNDCAVPLERVVVGERSIRSPTDQPMATGLCNRVIEFVPIAAGFANKLQVRVIGRPIQWYIQYII